MKNWKLKKMSYQELIGQLQAVRSILYYYQRGKDFPGICQLCKVSRTYHPRKLGNDTVCMNCLWMIVEGETCTDFGLKKYGQVQYVPCLTDTDRWHTYRIPMLRRWAKIIQAEMDCRTCGEA